MPTKDDLKYFQAMPLDVKVAMTKTRIREWVTYYGENYTYISFSGGKDITVLLHLVRELYPDIPAVFVNTGLEYPEIQAFAKSFDNVTVLTPKMTFPEVIKKYGYPMISKEVSQKIENASKGYPGAIKFVNGEAVDPEGNYSRYNVEKYKPLLYTDFRISAKCCDVMKKGPVHKYSKSTERMAFVATMADESMLRTQQWIRQGCNAFEAKNPTSKPMSFWTQRDVLEFIDQNNIKIASVYGKVVKADNTYQLSMFNQDDRCQYKTTGCDRTGCIFCGFGAHMDKYSRFLSLKETHPKQYRYCIEGGEHDIDGIWKPNQKGLGMGHVIDELNELYSKNGKPFIAY